MSMHNKCRGAESLLSPLSLMHQGGLRFSENTGYTAMRLYTQLLLMENGKGFLILQGLYVDTVYRSIVYCVGNKLCMRKLNVGVKR